MTLVPLIVRRVIDSPPTQVFSAFSRCSALQKWFTPSAEVSIEILEFDFTVGGRFRFQYTLADGRQSVVTGNYEFITEPRQIVMTWVWEPPDALADIPMRVTFDFLEVAGATEVVVTHEGIPSDQACTVHQDGWAGTFANLEFFLSS